MGHDNLPENPKPSNRDARCRGSARLRGGIPMSLIIHAGANAISYDELRAVSTPEGTETHIPVPHHEIVELMRNTLGFFGHEISEEHHAITPDGSRYDRTLFSVGELRPRHQIWRSTPLA